MLRTNDTPAPSPTSRWLVSTDWLGEHLRDRNLVVVDGSYSDVAPEKVVAAPDRRPHMDTDSDADALPAFCVLE